MVDAADAAECCDINQLAPRRHGISRPAAMSLIMYSRVILLLLLLLLRMMMLLIWRHRMRSLNARRRFAGPL